MSNSSIFYRISLLSYTLGEGCQSEYFVLFILSDTSKKMTSVLLTAITQWSNHTLI